jgi:predicted nuclease of restriction endonuclease-like (RecB) superfamily
LHRDHRFGTYEGQTAVQSNQGKLPEFDEDAHANPIQLTTPDCWVDRREVEARLDGRWNRGWCLGWRYICRSTDQRTVIASLTFFQVYERRQPEIRHNPCGELRGPKADRAAARVVADLSLAVDAVAQVQGFSPRLGWSHYRALMKVAHDSERLFYEIEAEQEQWIVEQLEHQIHTLLFARLRKSRDKAGVIELATRGQQLQRPIDTIRDPYVLDFLSLPESPQLHENALEAAIIAKLQEFLLELGKGFAFVGRQKRLTYDDQTFYVDLVFYNCILKCYLLIDLKLGRLTHQDVGQMDSYVRLFDDQFTTDGDNPTIGLILCAEKNEAVARYSVLHKNPQLFAAKYVTYLPTEQELQRELQRERLRLESPNQTAASP